MLALLDPVSASANTPKCQKTVKGTLSTVTYEEDLFKGQKFDGAGAENWLYNWVWRETGHEPRRQVTFLSGARRVDVYSQEWRVIYESKAGTGGQARKSVLDQAYKDGDLAKSQAMNGPVQRAEWHFFPGMSGYTGPSAKLCNYLQQMDISIVIHIPPRDHEDDYSKLKSKPEAKGEGKSWWWRVVDDLKPAVIVRDARPVPALPVPVPVP
jgi:hypothetical protein